MARKPIIFLFFILLMTSFGNKESFHSPVQGKMRLSGTFGELRNNHFHAGIDIKSQYSVDGDPIFSIEKGFVSRIRVSARGYGNSIYIDHPNGYTSVYAHLHSFTDEFQDYVLNLQEKHQTFEIDIYPPRHELRVKRGERIGSMGNTGSSNGVHLHFEIRETKSESPINPLHWPFDYTDDQRPFASHLHIYHIEDGPQVNLRSRHKLGGAYHDRSPWPRTLKLPEGEYGLGIKAYDPFNGWRNKNGLYKARVLLDSNEHFQFAMDSIPFHLSKYIDAHIDHDYYCRTYNRLHRLFRMESNKVPIYQDQLSDGSMRICEGDTTEVEIIMQDMSGKESRIRFSLLGMKKEVSNDPRDSLAFYLSPDRDTLIEGENCSIYFPRNAFHESNSLYPLLQLGKDSLPVIDIAQNCDAVHMGMDYQFRLPDLPDQLRPKTFIGQVRGSRIKDQGGEWSGDVLAARIKDLGRFSIFVDTVPPTIKFLYGRFRPNSVIHFRIRDQYDSRFRHIDLKYGAYVNGKWCYADFDKRYYRLRVHLPEDWEAGQDTLTVIARDRLGNDAEAGFPGS